MLSRISFVCAGAVVATVLSVPSFARGEDQHGAHSHGDRMLGSRR